MLRIILILLTLQATKLLSQDSLSNHLLLLENKIYLSNNDTVKTTYKLEKLNAYIHHKLYIPEAFNEARKIDYDNIVDSTQQVNYLWNAALMAHLTDNQRYAVHYIDRYNYISKDTSTVSQLLTLVINNAFDTLLVSQSVANLKQQNPAFDSLKCLNSIYTYKLAHKKNYRIASAILPGLGTAMLGYPGKGAMSFSIFGATTVATYILFTHNLYIGAVVWGAQLTMKFYEGNKRLTIGLANTKEAKQKNALAKDCKCILDKQLIKYPLNFK